MKALILNEYNNIVYENVTQPEFGEKEVLVKIKACGICGSDVHGMDGTSGRRQPPIIMGHEASGIIEKIGSKVENFRKEDKVTFDSTIYCGKCHYCRRGKINLCNNRRVLGVSSDEFRQDGAFAEYISVPEHILYLLPKNFSFEKAVFIEPLSIALHAVNLSPAGLTNRAAVIGAGMIGQLIIQLLKTLGTAEIIAVDLNDSRLETALDSGADIVLNPDETDPVEQILNKTSNSGVDISYEAVGFESTVNIASSSLRKGGTLILIGNLDANVKFPLQKIVSREIIVKGSCASSGEYKDCIDLIDRGIINVDRYISKTAPLKEGAKWFEKLYKGDSELMKVILKP